MLRTLPTSVAFSTLLIFALLSGARDVRADMTSSPQPGAGDSTGGVPESGGQTSGAILASPTVDPATGILHSSIPIQVPAARGAAEPGLSIGYSAEGGDGYLGYGWDLNVGAPTIVRNP